jgi:uncharacterized protein YmfQ (DUF2313 family)
MSASAYARVLKQLLPPGLVWNLEPDSNLSSLFLGIGEELARVEGRADALLEESDPRTATETLEEWERELGLPDAAIVSLPPTLEGRRLAIAQKLIRQGGQHHRFFTALAAACGYVVTLSDFFGSTILRVGFRAGARCYGAVWAHVWQMNVQRPLGPALSHAELEAIVRRAAPEHTVVLFNYV